MAVAKTERTNASKQSFRFIDFALIEELKRDAAFNRSYSAKLRNVEAGKAYSSETQAAAHSALIAGLSFFDGAVLGRGEFQQIAKLSGDLI